MKTIRNLFFFDQKILSYNFAFVTNEGEKVATLDVCPSSELFFDVKE